MTLVSVIMPYYKKEKFIRESVVSILNQSYKNFEIIIIDDEVSSKSHKILRSIMNLDKRIRILRNIKNLGAGESRNKGIKIARGSFIAFCDCDDLWNKEKLKYQLNFMKKNRINFSFTAYKIINEKTKKVISNRKAKEMINFDMLKKSCDIGLSTVVIKRKILEKFKLKFVNITTKEDFVLWLMLTKNGVKLYGIDKTLAVWRKTQNSLSSSVKQKLFDGFLVYRKYLNFNIIKSMIYLIILSTNFILKN